MELSLEVNSNALSHIVMLQWSEGEIYTLILSVSCILSQLLFICIQRKVQLKMHHHWSPLMTGYQLTSVPLKLFNAWSGITMRFSQMQIKLSGDSLWLLHPIILHRFFGQYYFFPPSPPRLWPITHIRMNHADFLEKSSTWSFCPVMWYCEVSFVKIFFF